VFALAFRGRVYIVNIYANHREQALYYSIPSASAFIHEINENVWSDCVLNIDMSIVFKT